MGRQATRNHISGTSDAHQRSLVGAVLGFSSFLAQANVTKVRRTATRRTAISATLMRGHELARLQRRHRGDSQSDDLRRLLRKDNSFLCWRNFSPSLALHVTGALAGGHAIHVLGWGTDAGVDYWLLANQWGTGWGMAGSVWFRRGINHLGIENYMYGSIPTVWGATTAMIVATTITTTTTSPPPPL